MDIPALSMAMSQVSIRNSVQLAVVGKAIDASETMADETINMMNNMSTEPYKGENIDVTV